MAGLQNPYPLPFRLSWTNTATADDPVLVPLFLARHSAEAIQHEGGGGGLLRLPNTPAVYAGPAVASPVREDLHITHSGHNARGLIWRNGPACPAASPVGGGMVSEDRLLLWFLSQSNPPQDGPLRRLGKPLQRLGLGVNVMRAPPLALQQSLTRDEVKMSSDRMGWLCLCHEQ